MNAKGFVYSHDEEYSYTLVPIREIKVKRYSETERTHAQKQRYT